MSRASGDQDWRLLIDADNKPIWYRRDGLTEAIVRRTDIDGYEPWCLEVGVGEFTSTFYAPSLRAAKVRATKLIRHFKPREVFYCALGAKLRLSIDPLGSEDSSYATSHTDPIDPFHIAEAGILWKWDHDSRVWRSGKWQLHYDADHGWLLRYPSGPVQVLRSMTRDQAMREAAFWIRRAQGD